MTEQAKRIFFALTSSKIFLLPNDTSQLNISGILRTGSLEVHLKMEWGGLSQ